MRRLGLCILGLCPFIFAPVSWAQQTVVINAQDDTPALLIAHARSHTQTPSAAKMPPKNPARLPPYAATVQPDTSNQDPQPGRNRLSQPPAESIGVPRPATVNRKTKTDFRTAATLPRTHTPTSLSTALPKPRPSINNAANAAGRTATPGPNNPRAFPLAPSSRKAAPFSKRDLTCLATAIYFEARSESIKGQVAVAQVVMNRVAHTAYPNTICGVIYQNHIYYNGCQFSFACDGFPEHVYSPVAWQRALVVARSVLRNKVWLKSLGVATHYHADYVDPDWAHVFDKVNTIGRHIFYDMGEQR